MRSSPSISLAKAPVIGDFLMESAWPPSESGEELRGVGIAVDMWEGRPLRNGNGHGWGQNKTQGRGWIGLDQATLPTTAAWSASN